MADVGKELEEFAEIAKPREPLAPYTFLKLGGPAEVLVQARNVAELCSFVRRCGAKKLPLRVLGGGCSVLVRDEGVRGVILRLEAKEYTQVTVQERQVR